MVKQPNSQNCFICGIANPFGLHMKFYEIAPGEVLAEFSVPDQYQGYPGVVHGGIVAAMLDEAAGRSQMKGYPPRFMYTARLDIRYRQNVPVGQPIKLVGQAGEDRRRTAKATSHIYDVNGNLLAEADVLLVNLPDEKISTVDLEALGWKIYPDDG